MKRTKFCADFKRKVVVKVMRGDRTVREVAARHVLNPNKVGKLKSEAMEGLLEVLRRGSTETWRSRAERRRS